MRTVFNISAGILPSKKLQDGTFNVYLIFTRERQTFRLNTKVNVLSDNFKNGKVFNDPNEAEKNKVITELYSHYEAKILTNGNKLLQMPFLSAKQFILYNKTQKPNNYLTFAGTVLNRFKSQNRTGTVRHYKDHISAIKKYKPDLQFSNIKQSWLEDFEIWLYGKGNSVNTVATRIRDVRYTFNRADAEMDFNFRSPFGKGRHKIRTEPGKHKNISIADIRKIIEYKPTSRLKITARDVFLMDLMLLGCNIKDLFYMPKSALIGDRLEFNRGKTGKPYYIKVENEVKKIMEVYAGEKYLFWFADLSDVILPKKHSRVSLRQYKNEQPFEKMLNKNMKAIQEELKLNGMNLITTYSIRHTVASLMHEIGVDDSVISAVLTHDSGAKVTLGYIDKSKLYLKIDRANRKLINYLFKKATPKGGEPIGV